MRKNLRYARLALGAVFFISLFSQAQDRFAYAITDVQQNTAGWTSLRKLNFQTGEFTNVLLNGMDASQVAYDAVSKKPVEVTPDARYGNYLQTAFSTGVAALAYDRKNDRLYFTPMFIDQLRYVDLKTMKLYYVTDQPFTKIGTMHNDEGKIVTRMVITEDGTGYALTNDATSFIRFNTGKKLQVEQLGSLVDDPNNTGISIQNRCSSWGGDMVADDQGNLYLFSAHNSVFKINIETKVATWLGMVKDLPAGFTINGAVVNDEGKLLVGSQGYAQSWYVLDPKTWSATAYNAPKGIYLTSDLANSNVLTTRKRNNTTEIPTIALRESALNNNVQMYPNPVSNNQFNLQFNKLTAGDYTIELTDVTGKQVFTQKVNISNETQVQTINLSNSTAKGIYLVKVSDIKSKSIFTQKLVVQ
jgi:hypothetical protein